MKPFNLNEYIQDPSRKIVTQDGRAVKIHCTNCVGSQPVIAEIEGEKYSYYYDKNGRYIYKPSISDLFFDTEKYEGWVNIYGGPKFSTDIKIFSSEEEAKKEGEKWKDYVTTIKIEWESKIR